MDLSELSITDGMALEKYPQSKFEILFITSGAARKKLAEFAEKHPEKIIRGDPEMNRTTERMVTTQDGREPATFNMSDDDITLSMTARECMELIHDLPLSSTSSVTVMVIRVDGEKLADLIAAPYVGSNRPAPLASLRDM